MSIYRILLTVILCTLANVALAQQQTIGAEANATLSDIAPQPIYQTASSAAPLGADVTITYLQTTNPQVTFTAPLLLGSNILVTYGERMTLPTLTGHLDSVSVELNGISNDSIQFLAIPDTLFQTASGPFHLMNIFDPKAKAALIGYIYASQISGRTKVTFRLPHVSVPQNFWLALQPNFVTATKQFTNSYQLIADTEAVRPRTTDNTHSGFLYISNTTGQVSSSIFDSTFTNSTTNTRYFSNFAFTAYADVTPSGVNDNRASAAGFRVYPNPASQKLEVRSDVAGDAKLELVDVLGRKILTAQFSGSASLDVSQILPGRYEAVLTRGSVVSHSSVIIGR